MTVDAKEEGCSGLSVEEERVINAAVKKCSASADTLIREIGVVYLRGMCDMLRVQGRISPEDVTTLLNRAKGC